MKWIVLLAKQILQSNGDLFTSYFEHLILQFAFKAGVLSAVLQPQSQLNLSHCPEELGGECTCQARANPETPEPQSRPHKGRIYQSQS